MTLILNPVRRFGKRNVARWIIFAVVAVAAVTFYVAVSYDRAYLQMVLSTSEKGEFFQLYWAGQNQAFSEDRSHIIKIVSGKNRHYGFYLTDLRNVRKIRIDPIKKPGKLAIHSITLSQEEIEPIELFGNRLKALEPVRDVAVVTYGPDGMVIASSGADPSLVWHIRPEITSSRRLAELLRVIVMIAFAWIIALCLTTTEGAFLQVNCRLGWLVFGFVVTMAVLSANNLHPDEYVHINAGRYYEGRWLPPKICEPGTENTYSVYGMSRLNSTELVYFLTGKIASAFYAIPLYDHLRLRLFNVCLFFLLLLSWHYHRNSVLFFIPMLITPQAWYLFSYVNSDAFALFVSLMICQQLVFPDTFLKRCWYAQAGEPWLVTRTVACGMLFGLLLFSKANFYIVYVFIAGYVLIELFFSERRLDIPWRRAAEILVGILIVSVFAYGPHALVNGLDRIPAITECREKLARKIYKPSTPLDEKGVNLYLKRKGIPLSYMLDEMNWGGRIFRSSVGVYGYLKYAGPEKYYQATKVLLIIFGAVIVFLGLLRGDNQSRLLLLWTIFCILLLIAIVMRRSWVSDVQPQGRYLMPILPMVGVMMYRLRSVLDKPIVHLITLLLFLASSYSFIFIGLSQIPKV